MAEPSIKKKAEMNKCFGGECPGGDCAPENIISSEMLLKGSEEDPCKGCGGDPCPHLEPDGFTCVAIEGLKVIPVATEQHCKGCDGNFCSAQGES